jgi:hypothetical protein
MNHITPRDFFLKIKIEDYILVWEVLALGENKKKNERKLCIEETRPQTSRYLYPDIFYLIVLNAL